MFALRRRARALVLVLPLAGCTELVVIGADCDPASDALCVVEIDSGSPGVGNLDAGLGVDSAASDLDARVVPPDASGDADADVDAQLDGGSWLDAGVAEFPPLQNPSFELTDGQPGDVATFSLPTGTVIAPWFSCQPIGGGPGALTGVRAERVTQTYDVTPPSALVSTHGQTFVAMQYFVTLVPPVLLQQLSEPLKPNVSYAMAVDVRSSNLSANLSLQVFGSNEACGNPANTTRLAVTPPITKPGWQTVCLRFSAPSAFTFFILQENARFPVSGDRLFFDNLRGVESCPP